MNTIMTTATVAYGNFGSAAAAFQQSWTCSLPHAEMVHRIERAIDGAGLWVLGKVDAQAFVRRGGQSLLGTLQILAFHPRFMVRLLEADPAALLGAPLKFAVLETPDGQVTITCADQAAAFARYENPALTELGRELAALCTSIMTDALRDQPA